MFPKILKLAVASLPFISPVTSVVISGYLGNACNGEELYSYLPDHAACVDVSNIQPAGSIVVSQFEANEIVSFFSDNACSFSSSQVGDAESEECFLVPIRQEVLSFMVIT